MGNPSSARASAAPASAASATPAADAAGMWLGRPRNPRRPRRLGRGLRRLRIVRFRRPRSRGSRRGGKPAGFELQEQRQDALQQTEDRFLQRPRQPVPRALRGHRRAHLPKGDREAVGQGIWGVGAHERNKNTAGAKSQGKNSQDFRRIKAVRIRAPAPAMGLTRASRGDCEKEQLDQIDAVIPAKAGVQRVVHGAASGIQNARGKLRE